MAITVADLLVNVRASTGQAEKQLAGFGKTLKGFGSQVASTAIGMVTSTMITSVTGALKGSIDMAIQAYSEYERLGYAINSLVAREAVAEGAFNNIQEAMGATKDRAVELQGWIQQLAIESPFGPEQIAQAFRMSLAYGFTTIQAQRLTQATLDFASGTGASQEAMGRIALALGQINVRGKVATQELNQLAEAGLDARSALAEGFGVTTGKLVEMVEKGLVPAKEAMSYIIGQMEEDFQGAAKAQANTFAGLLSSIEELKVSSARIFGEGTFEVIQPYLASLVGMMTSGSFKSTLAKMGDDLGSALKGPLEEISSTVGRFFDLLGSGASYTEAFITAFNLEPMAVQINAAIGWFEWVQNEWARTMQQMDLGTQMMAQGFIIAINKMRQAFNDLGASGNSFFNWFGEQAGAMTGNTFTAQEPPEWTKPLKVPTVAEKPFTPVELDRIPLGYNVDSPNWNPQAMEGGYGFQAMQNQDAQVAAANELKEAQIRAAEFGGKAFGDAGAAGAKDMVDAFKGALQQVPGLFGNSKVTQGDLDKAAAGLPVNFADDYVRQAADELTKGIDWANIDPAEVAASVGLDPSVPAQIIIDELMAQWASGEYFADPANLAKINWQAVKDAAQQEANSQLGQQNIIAEAMKQGITLESFKPLATETVAQMAAAVNTASTTVENVEALAEAGKTSARGFYDGWKTFMSEAPVVPPSGPPAWPPGVPQPPGVQGPQTAPVTLPGGYTLTFPVGENARGTDWWTGGTTWVGEQGPELVDLPRGSRVTPTSKVGSGTYPNITINAQVTNDYDLEKIAVRLARVMDNKKRRV